MAVPTSNQQLLFSSVYRGAISEPSAFKASAFVSSAVVLSSTANSSHKAEGPPSLVDARHCSSQKLQLVSSASRDVAGRGMTSAVCEVVRKAITARKNATHKKKRARGKKEGGQLDREVAEFDQDSRVTAGRTRCGEARLYTQMDGETRRLVWRQAARSVASEEELAICFNCPRRGRGEG
eukprot:s2655_g14.t1